jgi:hypothetical protein
LRKNLRKEDRRKFPGLFVSFVSSTSQQCQPEGVENIHQLFVTAVESLYPCHGLSVKSWVHTFLTMPVADKDEVLW